jgi:predicted SAM-dependent methyltransferase
MNKIIKNIIKSILPTMYYAKIKNIYLFLYFFGFKYKCPFCYKSLRKFLPWGLNLPSSLKGRIIGAGSRHVLCPFCGSKDRERLVYLFIKNKNLLKTNKTIKLLHVAPEKNLQKFIQKLPNINHTSVDLNSPFVDLKMDITAMKFPNNHFDVIICNHVLEHIENDRKAMSELYRVLKPEGWAILQVPISLSLDKTFEDSKIKTDVQRKKSFGQEDHVRIYGKDYKNRLEEVGFKVNLEKLDRKSNNKCALNKDENIYFCVK